MVIFMNKISAVVIFSSPHKNGNTAKILNAYLEKITFPLDIKFFDAYKLSPSPCIDCGYCKKQEKCAFDDLDALYSAIENCELLIIASPIYNMSFPSPMKAVLDRFQRYFNARFSLGLKPAVKKHRKAVLLASAGSSKETGEVMISQLKQSFSVMNTDFCTYAIINGLDSMPFVDSDKRLSDCANHLNSILSTICH